MGRILLVDDEPVVLQLFERQLTDAGYTVAAIEDPRQALPLLESGDFDAALVDLRLPHMDGPELIEAIRARKPDLPVIVVSGGGTREDIARALRAGCYDFLAKPILDFDLVLTTVARAVELRRSRAREREVHDQLRDAHERQRRQLRELELLHEVAMAWQGAFDERRLLRMILTCATSGQALGFNRAHVFLVSPDKTSLQGSMALGPSSGEDAGRIWSRLASLSLAEQLELQTDAEDDEVSRAIARLSIPLADSDQIVAACLHKRAAIIVNDAWNSPHVGRAFAEAIRAAEFACAPLIARDEVLGVLVVDNLYTGKPILPSDLRVLSTFANHAALALANAQGYTRLQNHLARMQRMQERLIEAERMAAVGNVATQVAHEIRNPLFVISGFAQRLAEMPHTDPRATDAARIILEEANRLSEVLSHVLSYLQSSTTMLTRGSLNDIVSAAAAAASDLLRDHKLVLDLELGALPEVEVDVRLMEHVIGALLEHATAATPPGGHIHVRTSAEGELIRLDVSDGGEPLPAEELAQLFNPFYTRPLEGHGANLAAAQKIIHSFGGALRVKNRGGQGTTITALLPSAEAKERMAAQSQLVLDNSL